MKKAALFFSFVLFISGAVAGNDGYYYRLHPKWTRTMDQCLVQDTNLDGNDDFFFKIGFQYDLRDYELESYYKSFKFLLDHPFKLIPIPALAADSIYFQVTYQRADTIFVKLLLPSAKTIGKSMQQEPLVDFIRFVKDSRTAPSDFKQSFTFLHRIRTQDGRILSLFETSTPWDIYGERAIYLMDYKIQKRYWKFSLGPYIINSRIYDFNQDGADEILLSTYASNNGVSGRSTKDDSSYIFLVDSNGKLIWQRCLGAYWTGAFADIGDFNGDGHQQVVCFQYSSRRTRTSQDRVYILDTADGSILLEKRYGSRFRLSPGATSRICADLNGDGKDEIVMGNSDGYMRVFDGNLQVIDQSGRFDDQLVLVGIEDLNGDGIFEIIAMLKDEKIVVFDHNLNQLCSWSGFSGNNRYPRIVRTNNRAFLLVTSLTEGNTKALLLELQRSIFPYQSTGVWNRYSLVFLLLFPLFAVAVYLYYRKSLYKQLVQILASIPNRFYDRMLLLTKSGKIRHIGCMALEWLQLSSSVRGRPYPMVLPQNTAVLQDLMMGKSDRARMAVGDTLLEITAVRFDRINLIGLVFSDAAEQDHIKQVKLWARLAQRLAHGIKNPLTSVKLNAQELKVLLQDKYCLEDDDIPQYLDAITAQVRKLKRMADGFMRFVEFEQPELRRVDINALLRRWVEEWSVGQSSRIQLDWDLAEPLPLVKLDADQFVFAFRSIYFNAVESIEGKGSISISSRRVQLITEKNSVAFFIEIQVQDTGRGIAPDYLDKVKQPYFTLKAEGTGLGLSIAEKIMQSHQGSMSIESRPEEGTTVTLRFPLAN